MTLPIQDHPSFHDQLPLGDYETLQFVAALAARPEMRAIEIGCWGGKGSVAIGKIVQNLDGMLFCVDHWKGSTSDAGETLSGIATEIDVFGYWQELIDKSNLSNFVIPIRLDSQNALRAFADNYFDFIFIDADHSYSAVKRDIIGYWRKLKVGGTMAGHDYDEVFTDARRPFYEANKEEDNADGVHCGVVLAVNELFPNRFQAKHRIWWTKKETA